LTRVKYRRWGPYVWWICPSRKCNFENKTDLAFVQGEFLTKCQYCNTPITIRFSSGQLDLQSVGTEEEEAKPAPSVATPKPSATTPAPQAPLNPSVSAPAAAPASSSPPMSPPGPPSPSTVNNQSETTQTEPVAAKDSEPAKKQKEPKKKAAS
jgi:hypothetical protein